MSRVTRIARTTSLILKIKNQTGADPANATYCQQVGTVVVLFVGTTTAFKQVMLNSTQLCHHKA